MAQVTAALTTGPSREVRTVWAHVVIEMTHCYLHGDRRRSGYRSGLRVVSVWILV